MLGSNVMTLSRPFDNSTAGYNQLFGKILVNEVFRDGTHRCGMLVFELQERTRGWTAVTQACVQKAVRRIAESAPHHYQL